MVSTSDSTRVPPVTALLSPPASPHTDNNRSIRLTTSARRSVEDEPLSLAVAASFANAARKSAVSAGAEQADTRIRGYGGHQRGDSASSSLSSCFSNNEDEDYD